MTHTWQDYMTLGVRITTFALSLSLLGAFLLPWVSLDGLGTYRGTDLLGVFTSPYVKYLYTASPMSAWFVLGCPVGIALFSIFVAWQYARRRTAIISTLVVLALSIALPYGASGLLAQGTPSFRTGLAWIVAAAVLLLIQQILIKVSTKLRTKRKFPATYRALAVVTGSGYSRWNT